MSLDKRKVGGSMAYKDKKDFNAMLHDNKDMPKFPTNTGQKSIEKYGGSKIENGAGTA